MNIFPVNDKLIMCVLDQEDLMRHDISIADFTHASSKTKSFFSEIIQQIVRDLDFIEDNTSLAIETMLSVSGLLILTISKVENPELLRKTGNTLFIPVSGSSRSSEVGKKAGRDLDEAKRIKEQSLEDVLNFTSNLIQNVFQERSAFGTKNVPSLKACIGLDDKDANLDNVTGSVPTESFTINTEFFKDNDSKLADAPLPEKHLVEVFSFSTLADIARLASSLGSTYKGKSAVYKDDAENLYWLKLELNEYDEAEMRRIRGIATEFGNCLLRGLPYRAFLDEQCKPVIKSGAIKKLMLLNMH